GSGPMVMLRASWLRYHRMRRAAVGLVLAAAALPLGYAALRVDATFYQRHVAPDYCVGPGGAPWIFTALRVVVGLVAVALLVLAVRVRPRPGGGGAAPGIALALV